MEKLHPDGPERLAFETIKAHVGRLTFRAGERLPAEGTSVHDQHEVTFILAGTLQAHSGGRDYTLTAGDVTLIPAGEHHHATVIEDVTLCYVLLDVTA